MSSSPSSIRKTENYQCGSSFNLTPIDLEVLHQHFPESFTLQLRVGNSNSHKGQTNAKINFKNKCCNKTYYYNVISLPLTCCKAQPGAHFLKEHLKGILWDFPYPQQKWPRNYPGVREYNCLNHIRKLWWMQYNLYSEELSIHTTPSGYTHSTADHSLPEVAGSSYTQCKRVKKRWNIDVLLKCCKNTQCPFRSHTCPGC